MERAVDGYCNQKFWWLSVDVDGFQMASCCSARPQRIQHQWLKQNPGGLFNTPELIGDREHMLEGRMIAGCHHNCYAPEAAGIKSRRDIMQGHVRSHINTVSDPEHVNIILGTNCNMMCAYCCKIYSSSWARDLMRHGEYDIDVSDGRYSLTAKDRIRLALGQKDMSSSNFRNDLLAETIALTKKSSVKSIDITGGEPFLYLELADIVASMPDHVPIMIWSGLGVNHTRFRKQLTKLRDRSNVSLVISIESTGPLYQLIRNGNTWETLQQNLATVQELGVAYKFNATVTNLSLFGLEEFVRWARDIEIMFALCTDPDFLSVHVLDASSKQQLGSCALPDHIKSSMLVEPSPQQISNLNGFLRQFSQRSRSDLTVLPAPFLRWCGL